MTLSQQFTALMRAAYARAEEAHTVHDAIAYRALGDALAKLPLDALAGRPPLLPGKDR